MRTYKHGGVGYKLHDRDSQRQKVYDSEASARLGEAAREVLGDGSVAAVEAHVREVCATATWEDLCRKNRGRVVPASEIRVEDGRGARSAKGWHDGISVPRSMRNKAVVIHELAHVVTHNGYKSARHHWPFAAALLALVGRMLGLEARASLEAEFKKRGVRHTAPPARKPMSPEALARLRARGHQLAEARRAAAQKQKQGNEGSH